MRRQRFFLFYASLLLLCLSLLACGSGVSQLESISINPATATAQDSTSGTVQFTATGTYADGRTVSPLPVFWGFQPPWQETPVPGGVNINSNGLAQCTTFKGTIPIVALAPKNPDMPLSAMTMSTPLVGATAKLTCQ